MRKLYIKTLGIILAAQGVSLAVLPLISPPLFYAVCAGIDVLTISCLSKYYVPKLTLPMCVLLMIAIVVQFVGFLANNYAIAEIYYSYPYLLWIIMIAQVLLLFWSGFGLFVGRNIDGDINSSESLAGRHYRHPA